MSHKLQSLLAALSIVLVGLLFYGAIPVAILFRWYWWPIMWLLAYAAWEGFLKWSNYEERP